MKTLSNQLEQYLQEADGWVSKHMLVRHTWRNQKENTNYSPETVAVQLREMERACRIAVRHDEQGHSEYRYIPEPHRSNYLPISERPAGSEHMLWRGQVPTRAVAKTRLEPVLDKRGLPVAMREIPV